MSLLHRLRQHPLRRGMGALALSVCLAGWVWLLWPLLVRPDEPGAPPRLASQAPWWEQLAHSDLPDPAAALKAAPPSLGSTALQAAEWPGRWALNSAGVIQPSADVRRRFDHLLSRLGDQNLLQLRTSMQQQVTEEAGPAAAEQVVVLWDRYLRLQLWPWKTEVELDRPDTWRQALNERSRIRRDLLGPAFAEAFFGADEREFLKWIEARAPAPSSSPLPVEAYGPASREAALSQEWQRWERRLEASRRTLEQVQQAPDLSPEQRRIAMQQHFSAAYEGSERRRAEALLSAGAR
ncbi:MAG: hypothetical protein ACK5O3_09025 [Burkholderiales bacterium]